MKKERNEQIIKTHADTAFVHVVVAIAVVVCCFFFYSLTPNERQKNEQA